MNYTGKLYGKIGNKYFDTEKTSNDFDELVEKLEDILETIRDCQTPKLYEIEELIKKHK